MAINKSNVVAWVLIGAVAAAGGVFYLRSRQPVRVALGDLPKADDAVLVVEGTVQPINDANKDVNALKLGNTRLDAFILNDGPDGAWIYFDPGALAMPTAGARVRVTGGKTEQRGVGVMRFIARRIERI